MCYCMHARVGLSSIIVASYTISKITDGIYIFVQSLATYNVRSSGSVVLQLSITLL